MNHTLIRRYAEQLEALLDRYASENTDVRVLATSLGDLISRAKEGKIATPVPRENIPGRYWFTERGLSKFDELENAWVKFKMQISGEADDPDTQAALQMIKKMQEGMRQDS